MCCLCLLEIYMTLFLEILSAITDVHHHAGLLQSLYAGSVDEYRGGHQVVITFGFDYGMQTKLRQRSGSVVNAQCTRSARAVTTRCAKWKRHLERRRNAMEPRRNAKVAVRSP